MKLSKPPEKYQKKEILRNSMTPLLISFYLFINKRTLVWLLIWLIKYSVVFHLFGNF